MEIWEGKMEGIKKKKFQWQGKAWSHIIRRQAWHVLRGSGRQYMWECFYSAEISEAKIGLLVGGNGHCQKIKIALKTRGVSISSRNTTRQCMCLTGYELLLLVF